MSDLFVGRQPIFDRSLNVVAYELLYRSGQANSAQFLDGDQATTQVILNTFVQIGLQNLVGDRKAFINTTRSFLVGRHPLPLPPGTVVLEVLETIAVDPELIDGLTHLARNGYQIALDDVRSLERIAPLLPLAQIVKIDLMALPAGQLPEILADFGPYRNRLKLLAEKVETQEDLEVCLRLGFDYFQGYFLCKPNTVQARRIDSTRLVILRTLSRIQDPAAGLPELSELVAQDVTLSYKLLKLVNSAYYSLPTTITSIHHAIALIGLNHLRGWLALLLMTSVDNKPHELTVIAMARARMCEELARAYQRQPIELYFLAGLFSVLDALLDLSMQEAIASLPLPAEVVQGLLHRTGPIGDVLRVALAYERGDWSELGDTGLTVERLRQSFIDAVQWAADLSAFID